MDISLIDATLKYGEFKYTERKKLILEIVGSLIITAVLEVFAIIFLIYSKFTYIEVLGINAILIILWIVCLLIYKKQNKQSKEVKLWLQDAVEINAVTSQAGENKSVAMLTPITLYKLQVDFDYNGRHYTYFSKNEYKIKFDSPPTGFHKIWERYINKNVKIMYSPKYDEVMLVRGSAKDFLKPLYGNNNKRK